MKKAGLTMVSTPWIMCVEKSFSGIAAGFEAVAVAGEAFLKPGFQRGREIGAGLVGQADHHPQHVGKFLGQCVAQVARFGHLLAVGARYDARQLAGLLGQHGHVGQR